MRARRSSGPEEALESNRTVELARYAVQLAHALAKAGADLRLLDVDAVFREAGSPEASPTVEMQVQGDVGGLDDAALTRIAASVLLEWQTRGGFGTWQAHVTARTEARAGAPVASLTTAAAAIPPSSGRGAARLRRPESAIPAVSPPAGRRRPPPRLPSLPRLPHLPRVRFGPPALHLPRVRLAPPVLHLPRLRHARLIAVVGALGAAAAVAASMWDGRLPQLSASAQPSRPTAASQVVLAAATQPAPATQPPEPTATAQSSEAAAPTQARVASTVTRVPEQAAATPVPPAVAAEATPSPQPLLPLAAEATPSPTLPAAVTASPVRAAAVTPLPSPKPSLAFVAGQASPPGWPNSQASTAWFAPDGYHLFARQPQRFVAVGVAPDQLANVLVAATFHKVDGPTGGGYGIILRDQGPPPRDGLNQAGRYFVLEVGDRGEIGVWRRDQDQWVDIVPWFASSAVRVESGENQLVAKASGDQLTLSVNGTDVITRSDASLTSGSVGVFAGGDQNEVVLTQLSVQPLD